MTKEEIIEKIVKPLGRFLILLLVPLMIALIWFDSNVLFILRLILTDMLLILMCLILDKRQ